MNKFCKECGNKLENSAKFCSSCGSKIDIDDSTNKISTDVNVNFTNKTTEKIINDVSEGAKKVKNKTFSILSILIPIIIIVLIVAGSIQYTVQENSRKKTDAIWKKKRELAEIELKNKKDNKIKSDAKYWNDGFGFNFKSNDGYNLPLKIKKRESDYIEYSSHVLEKSYLDNTYSMAGLAFELHYMDYSDGSYDIERVTVTADSDRSVYFIDSNGKKQYTSRIRSGTKVYFNEELR